MRLKTSQDRDWSAYMKRALELAHTGQGKGDIPVGALVVNADGKIVSEEASVIIAAQYTSRHAALSSFTKVSIV